MTAQQIQTIGNALARPGRLGDGGDRARVRGRRSGLGVAAAALSAGPALVGKAVVAVFGEDEMIQQRNAEQISQLRAAVWSGRDLRGSA
jgi:hypothetical protein